jgi:hypothetical protein
MLGKAVLELHPWHWRAGGDVDQAVTVLRALWRASEYVLAVSISHGGVVLVEVAMPIDGSLDLHALWERLQRIATEATTCSPRSGPPR